MPTSSKYIEDIGPEFLRKGSSFVSEQDVEAVKKRTESILSAFAKNRSLRKFIREATILVGLIKDYTSGGYKEIPWWAISAVVFTLLYVINPFDLIPDAIPIVGYLDDATVVTTCLSLISRELNAYQKWKSKRDKDSFVNSL